MTHPTYNASPSLLARHVPVGILLHTDYTFTMENGVAVASGGMYGNTYYYMGREFWHCGARGYVLSDGSGHFPTLLGAVQAIENS